MPVPKLSWACSILDSSPGTTRCSSNPNAFTRKVDGTWRILVPQARDDRSVGAHSTSSSSATDGSLQPSWPGSYAGV